MRVLIAGATGTLGMPLVRELVARNHQVIGLTRTPAKRPILEKLGAEIVVADALDAAALESVVRDSRPDHVVHLLTAIPKKGPLRVSHMAATNKLRTVGTANLLRASIAAGARRIVGESMIFAYGYGDHGEAKKVETDALQPEEKFGLMRGMVGAVRSLENQLLDADRKGLIEAVVLRFGLLYGPDVPSTQFAVQMLFKRAFPAVRGTDGTKSWIHSIDAVSAIVVALERGRHGAIYNIVDDEPVNNKDFLLFAAHALGAPRPRSIPLWLVRLTSRYAAVSLSTRLPVSNEKAKRELGWNLRFPNYEAGLKNVAASVGKR